jgi:UDP-N-acetylglucosamine--N-acetylmuramyl-(pentapeptide) pyrophosphoryl-undecaprenol N-acetylglucosamine transferase
MPNILIAGGGSGGHVAPAIAVAETLTAKGYQCILAHSQRAIDKLMVEQTPFSHFTLDASPLSLRPIGCIRFIRGFWQSEKTVRLYIKQNEIKCVISTGGFVSAPALRAAKKINCPTVMLNFDDPPGKANRLAVRWADRVLTTVPCQLDSATLVNPPLRKCVLASSNSFQTYSEYDLNPQKMTLLVTGASQGATSINAFIPALAKRCASLFQGWQVLHIAGSGNVQEVKKLWDETNVQHKVIAFEQRMGNAWGISDLAVTRGGANTIAEIAINAIPAIVLPYPYHKDEHQKTNALPLQSIGGILIEKDYVNVQANIASAGNTLLQLLKDHQQRLTMRQALVTHTPSNGSSTIAEACIELIG